MAYDPTPGIERRSLLVDAGPAARVIGMAEPAGGLPAVGGTLYFTEPYAGRVRKCTLPGCNAPVDVATAQGHVTRLATDGKAVYWISTGVGTPAETMALRKAPL